MYTGAELSIYFKLYTFIHFFVVLFAYEAVSIFRDVMSTDSENI